jgi:hypothetical protein
MQRSSWFCCIIHCCASIPKRRLPPCCALQHASAALARCIRAAVTQLQQRAWLTAQLAELKAAAAAAAGSDNNKGKSSTSKGSSSSSRDGSSKGAAAQMVVKGLDMAAARTELSRVSRCCRLV